MESGVERKVEVAIVGGGTAGMAAWREVSKHTENFVFINGGPFGTTCARVGCMPSKLLIQAANDFHRRHKFTELGINGADTITLNAKHVLERVRKYRDRFVSGVLKSLDSMGDKKIAGYARFEEPGVLRVEGQRIIAKKIILAVGTRPFVPKAWSSEKDRILTTDDIFELEDLPLSLCLVGTGVIGLELGQALSRLGVKVKAIGSNSQLTFLSDPEINDYAIKHFESEFESLELGRLAKLSDAKESEKILMATGRRPNFDLLEFQNSGALVNERGHPEFDPHSMQVLHLKNLFIAGDVTSDRQILHEAADEGRIAGYNAVREESKRFLRRCPIGIVFTDPNIAFCGASFRELKNIDPICGEVSFEGQGRALVMAKNKGILRIYAHRQTGRILGAEMIGPSCEHLAHLISWSIQQKLTAFDMLALPFYHPVIEEGLRTAVRDISRQVEGELPELEIPPCELLETE